MIHRLILKDQFSGAWLRFEHCQHIIRTDNPQDVLSALQQVQNKVTREQLYGAGFVTYEAAPGFDKAMGTAADSLAPVGDATMCPENRLPLLCFGLFKSVRQAKNLDDLAPLKTSSKLTQLDWQPELTQDQYLKTIKQIKSQIAAGNTYQVNFTLRQYASLKPPLSPWQIFRSFAPHAPYAAYVELDHTAICSASPELFFAADNNRLTCRPMKGTAPRGKTPAADRQAAQLLQQSEKNRAENLMIVDMIRNDLGKIALPGSVKVSNPFAIEKYPTLWQMTSTINAMSNADLVEIFTALFPCASITGAPKIETMKLIRQLESSARGIYTGSIGYLSPAGKMQFNVAIRTAMVDTRTGDLSYGIGAGIIWDSNPQDEYAECLLKSKVLRGAGAIDEFSLLESILWNPQEQYFLLDYHQRRLHDSADYFDFPLAEAAVDSALAQLATGFDNQHYKVRLLVNNLGVVSISAESIPADTSGARQSKRVTLARDPVSSEEVFLYHKTTQRSVYQAAIAAGEVTSDPVEDVILWNERGEITESTRANIVVRLNDRLLTPPISSGLLAGTFRQHLLDQDQVAEQILYKEDLFQASEIWLVNSVRRWQLAELQP